jgi:hypothetical protein
MALGMWLLRRLLKLDLELELELEMEKLLEPV